jgi:hypothetical protein
MEMTMRIYVHQESELDAQTVEVDESIRVSEAFSVGSEEGVLVLIEDTDEVLELTAAVGHAGIQDRGHVFVGRRHRVIAMVTFNGVMHERAFSSSTRVKRVFEWATGKEAFDLGKIDAAEHTLALASTETVPAGDVHLGSLVTDDSDRVAFDLVPKHRYEG